MELQKLKKKKFMEEFRAKQMSKVPEFQDHYTSFKNSFYEIFEGIMKSLADFKDVSEEKTEKIKNLQKNFQKHCIHPLQFKTEVSYLNYEETSLYQPYSVSEMKCNGCILCNCTDKRSIYVEKPSRYCRTPYSFYSPEYLDEISMDHIDLIFLEFPGLDLKLRQDIQKVSPIPVYENLWYSQNKFVYYSLE
jgi:hypothetical protein